MLVIVGVKCREGFLHTVPITPVDNTFGYMIADKLGWTPEGRRARGRPKTTWRRTVEKDSRNKGGWKSCGKYPKRLRKTESVGQTA